MDNQIVMINLLESAKKNRKGLNRLKIAVVTLQQFEMAAKLREIENEAFPETEEVRDAKAHARSLRKALAIVGIEVSEAGAWLVEQTIKLYNEKQGRFSIDDATTLRCKQEEIFNME